MAVLSILGIFFFPVLQGPYSAVHGPATALLSIRAAARLRLMIVRSGLAAVRDSLCRAAMTLIALSWSALSSTLCTLHSLPSELCPVLRC